MPIVCGVPRSGTTMLRLLLDAHPELAIPPETGFLGPLGSETGPLPRSEMMRILTQTPAEAPAWPDFSLDRGGLEAALPPGPLVDRADGVRAFYRLYAGQHGKRRWGDKTPRNALALPQIAGLLPEARFIHLVRDARDVIASWRRQWFAPSADVAVLAREWCGTLAAVESAAAEGVPCIEVGFEALAGDPPRALREICRFIEIDYAPQMLEDDQRKARRLLEHRERRTRDGTVLVSLARRREQQQHSSRPPDVGLVGRWRELLTVREIEAIEAVAGRVLERRGYVVGEAARRSTIPGSA